MKRETESSIEAMESQTENNINALKIESTKIIGEIIALKIESTKIIDMKEEIIALKKKIDTPVTTQKRKANNEREKQVGSKCYGLLIGFLMTD